MATSGFLPGSGPTPPVPIPSLPAGFTGGMLPGGASPQGPPFPWGGPGAMGGEPRMGRGGFRQPLGQATICPWTGPGADGQYVENRAVPTLPLIEVNRRFAAFCKQPTQQTAENVAACNASKSALDVFTKSASPDLMLRGCLMFPVGKTSNSGGGDTMMWACSDEPVGYVGAWFAPTTQTLTLKGGAQQGTTLCVGASSVGVRCAIADKVSDMTLSLAPASGSSDGAAAPRTGSAGAGKALPLLLHGCLSRNAGGASAAASPGYCSWIVPDTAASAGDIKLAAVVAYRSCGPDLLLSAKDINLFPGLVNTAKISQSDIGTSDADSEKIMGIPRAAFIAIVVVASLAAFGAVLTLVYFAMRRDKKRKHETSPAPRQQPAGYRESDKYTDNVNSPETIKNSAPWRETYASSALTPRERSVMRPNSDVHF